MAETALAIGVMLVGNFFNKRHDAKKQQKQNEHRLRCIAEENRQAAQAQINAQINAAISVNMAANNAA